MLTKCLLGLTLAVLSNLSWAQWELNSDRSSLNFISIKNDSVAETHEFRSLVGFISEQGQVQVTIDLTSVETLIDIRNTRLRELLFETEQFPTASVTAKVDPAILAAALEGVVSTDIEVELSLHGHSHRLIVPVTIVGDSGDNATGGELRVISSRPVIVDAADFALLAGVVALREIAGLSAISFAVPVSLHLVFDAAP